MITNTNAEAIAPASMGNVGVGFDILGLAFAGLWDSAKVTLQDIPGAIILEIEGNDAIPKETGRNTATVAVNAYLKTIGSPRGVGIHLKKGLPLSGGLGGSAASAVAAVMATNALFGGCLPREALLPACLEGEAAVSGYHLDNVAPALFGGITLTTNGHPPDIQQLPVPDGLFFALVTPEIAVPTAEARKALPEYIPLKKLIAQTWAVARLIDALHPGDQITAARMMEQDQVIEPARAHLIPQLHPVRQAAKEAGALAVIISGSGPTLCAVCDSQALSQSAADAMRSVYARAEIPCTTHCTYIDTQGAQIVSVY